MKRRGVYRILVQGDASKMGSLFKAASKNRRQKRKKPVVKGILIPGYHLFVQPFFAWASDVKETFSVFPASLAGAPGMRAANGQPALGSHGGLRPSGICLH